MKKKLFCFVLMCAMLLSFSPGAFAVIYGRSGYENEGYSEATAWEIDSAAVLAKFRDDVNNGKLNYEYYVKLTKDIDLTSYRTWTPIGGTADSIYAEAEYSKPFRGHFNGDGHTIKVKISEMAQDRSKLHHGLFGIVARGSIKNLNVEGTVEAYMRAKAQILLVGGVASIILGGSIENCKFNGSVGAYNQGQYANEAYAGGITAMAGYSYQSYYYGTVSIKNCKTGSKSDTSITATCNTTPDWQRCGSIVGYIYSSKCEITGNYGRATLDGTSICCIYGGRSNFECIVEDNIEADPSDPPPDSLIAPKITTSSLKEGTAGTAYSVQLKASGTTPITYSLTSGKLPAGLKLTKAGKISGTPTEAGTFTLKIKANNTAGSNTKTFKLTIKAVKPKITTAATLKDATINEAYSLTLSATGTKPITWKKTGGTLPNGIKLTSAGKLTGTPTKADTFSFTLKATNSSGSVSRTFKLTVKAVKPKITTAATLKDTAINKSYSLTLSATGTKPITWKKTGGTLPNGIKLTSAGKLTGTPTKAGAFSFTLKATNSGGSASRTFKLTVTKPTISASFKNSGTVDKKYNSSVTVTGGTSAYKWTKSGTLPSGLALNFSGAKATLSGTPKKAGNFTFTLKVTDKNGAAVSKKFTVKIASSTASSSAAAQNGTTAMTFGSPELSENASGNFTIRAALNVADDDIVESYEGKDSDMIKVKAGKPVTFIIGEWSGDVDGIVVYVDDKAVDSAAVKENKFTLPAEMVHDDFKVCAKSGELETEEVFIISE